jgi:hypothetical protein
MRPKPRIPVSPWPSAPPTAEGEGESDADVVEITLLLSRRDAAALEGRAHRYGLSAGQLLRGVLREFLRGTPA